MIKVIQGQGFLDYIIIIITYGVILFIVHDKKKAYPDFSRTFDNVQEYLLWHSFTHL